MNKVKMIKSFPVSLDGLRTTVWTEGSIQHPDDRMLDILIGEGAVEIVQPFENKAITGKVGRPKKNAF